MKLVKSLPFKLLMGVVIGILIGQFLPEGGALLQIVVTAKYIMGQLINFCVPPVSYTHLPLPTILRV